MSTIIKGSDMSNYVTVGMSVGVAKKENSDHMKARFVVFTCQDEEGGFSGSIKHIMFEDDLFPGAIDILKGYLLQDASGKPATDPKGGYPINMAALKASKDAEQFQRYLRIPGGMVMDYHLRKGECYANTIDGGTVTDKDNNPVKKSVIPVFVQVKFFMVGEDGKMVPNFANKMGLNERGDRLERTFYKNAVKKTVEAAPEETAPVVETKTEADPF